MYPGSHSYLTIVPYERPSPFNIVMLAWGTSGKAAHWEAKTNWLVYTNI